MKAEVLANFSEVWLTSIALVLFVTVFIGVTFILWNRNSQKTLEEAQNLPFDEGMRK